MNESASSSSCLFNYFISFYLSQTCVYNISPAFYKHNPKYGLQLMSDDFIIEKLIGKPRVDTVTGLKV